MPSSAVTTLAAIRSAIGTSGWLMPITAGKLFGIDGSKDATAALYLRLGGSRDFALAAGPLLTEGEASKQMLKVAGACDIGDILAVLIARKQSKIGNLGAVLFVGASSACLALVAKALSED